MVGNPADGAVERGLRTRLRWGAYYAIQIAQAWAKRHKDATPRLAGPINSIIRTTALPVGAAVLCIGARNRVELDLWRGRGYKAEGIDLLPRRGIRLMDMHRLRYPNDSFDLVFASHCFEHALEPARALAEATRVLKPRGYLYAAFPVGFKPNAHDRVDFSGPNGFTRLLPSGLRWELLWGAAVGVERISEWRILLRVWR